MARSNWYGSPVKIFEYGALGRPIVAPDTGPVRDVMEHGVDGLLVQPCVNELTAAIQRLLREPSLAESMGAGFQRKVREHHLWRHVAARILKASGVRAPDEAGREGGTA